LSQDTRHVAGARGDRRRGRQPAGGIGDPGYDSMIATIDARIASRPLLR